MAHLKYTDKGEPYASPGGGGPTGYVPSAPCDPVFEDDDERENSKDIAEDRPTTTLNTRRTSTIPFQEPTLVETVQNFISDHTLGITVLLGTTAVLTYAGIRYFCK
ncbi:hypothetical protein HN592_01170 [Candidatus Woesearchaeota archaeon]|jgi:hypothetical protein|nr:hypothetical protein [Candidatus Woesearchaeota archaeon]MBT3304061.1 hypothetical protein [Candidatus Woesearchaeota archaeon]MBT4368643.1 hypothetical protein [Candidatus Woesearchaeota archaeon]MBT4713134.1 hypothetical protein [Candidatus Woesearchaeota archaeon]MBT6638970.1 hypothetical protein [Candidatus Woesearchaeota archaeon]